MIGTRASSFAAGGSQGKGLFNREIGPLQSQLHLGEYDLLRLAPMLESDFVQVSKRGEVIDVHNQVQTVTVGVACTSAIHMVPNVLVLARPIIPRKESHPKLKSLLRHHPPPKRFELTRLLPLRFVKISIHNLEKKQLRFKLASGRTFYLQLIPQPGQQEDLFPLWVKVVHMLRPPSETTSELQENIKDIGGRGETPVHKPQSLAFFNSEEDKDDKVSIRSVYLAPEELKTDVRSRQSVGLSFEHPLSPQSLIRYPAITDGRSAELASAATSVSDDVGIDEPLHMHSRQRSDSSVKEEESVDISASRRRSSKNRRGSRSKSSRKARPKKPSKIFSLITSCSWGSRRKRSRDRKSRNKSKKR